MSDISNYPVIQFEPVIPTDIFDRYEKELYAALLIRFTEQRLLKLFNEGKIFGTVHTCIGQEFVGVAVARALQSEDTIFSNHRGHGHFLAYSRDVLSLISEVMGKEIGASGGRGGSQHLHLNHFYSNGIQGGIVPVATGLACAHKFKKTKNISVVYVGDGTLGQGALYESLNIASKWDLPILFVCENNFFAQSTCQTQTLAGDICARAQAFGIETAHNNTWDWPNLFQNIQASINYVRGKSRPFFHRIDTFRLMPHSKGDDNRSQEYIQQHWSRDPLSIIVQRYTGNERFDRMLREIESKIDGAVKQAEATPFSHFASQLETSQSGTEQWKKDSFPKVRMVAGIRQGLEDAMLQDPSIVLLGEDIESPYGGAFKCTAELSLKFPGRVWNTPISEAAIVGIGNGLALGGIKPVVEIMFGDFLTLTADQWINHASKFRFMYNDKVKIPLVIRTPMGGKRGYGPTHSQSIEKHFLGVPDTRVLCLHHRLNPITFYRQLFNENDRPTLVLENKLLYGTHCSSEAPPGYELLFNEAVFPVARLKPLAKPEVTILAIGGMSQEAEEAALKLFTEKEIVTELFFPSQIYPFNVHFLKASLQTTKRLLVVEEGQGFVSMSSEVLAQVMENYAELGVKCERLTAVPKPIPASRPLEQQFLPNTDAIIHRVSEMMNG